MSFFSDRVTRNVRKTAIIGFAVTGCLSVVGSFLIERKSQDAGNAAEEIEIEG